MAFKTILAAALVAASTSAASAASFLAFQGDATFNALCNQGSSNTDCEFAVGEMRGGNGAINGDWEVGVQNPPGTPVNVRQFAWGNGVAQEFAFGYDANLGVLSLSLTGGPTSSTVFGPLTDMKSLFIRTRSQSATETAELTGLEIDGHALPDQTFLGAGSNGARYLQIAGIDWSQDWSLTGFATMSWDGASIPGGSRLDVNFKLTDLDPPAPIPLPAAGWLLIASLGGLAALRRRA